MNNNYFTVSDIIVQALQNIGAISFGEGVEPAVNQSCILQLNALLRQYSNNYMNYKIYDGYVTVSANTPKIQLGTAINGNELIYPIANISARPASISQVDIIMGTLTFSIPIKSYEEYTRLPIKNVTSIPQSCYYQIGMPFDYLWFYPQVPVGYSVRVVGKDQFPTYTNPADMIIMPPEYVEVLIYDLAIHLAPMFGQNPSEGLIIMANSAKKHIKQRNVLQHIPRTMNDFSGNNGGRNFWSGF
jgi:hypothetical protein